MIDPASLPYRPCVGIMLINADSLVFAARRKDMPEAWQMPQGGVDPGEDARTAALRELQEETSVPPDAVDLIAEAPDLIRYDLPPHLMGKVWKGRFRGQQQQWFLGRFTGSDALIDLDTEHPEFDAWQWMTPEALLAQIVAFKRDVYRQVIAAFADRL